MSTSLSAAPADDSPRPRPAPAALGSETANHTSRIKGTALVNAVKVLRAHRGAARRLLPVSLWSYLDTNVLVSEWYPDDDFMSILQAVTRILPEPEDMDVWEWLGRHGARTDLRDIYTSMVHRGDVAGTLRRYPRVWNLYHDSGGVHVEARDGEGRVDIRHPLIAYPEFCRLQTGHLAELLAIAGADDVRVRIVQRSPARSTACWTAAWRV